MKTRILSWVKNSVFDSKIFVIFLLILCSNIGVISARKSIVSTNPFNQTAVFSGLPELSLALNNACLVCDNITNGGEIEGDETGCGVPTWDPSIIINVVTPTGGTGTIEYMWMMTTDDPGKPIMLWTPIPNSNSASYDPGPISQTTYYTRCSRRSGCSIFTGESNIVEKKLQCCDNITNPGSISANQSTCISPFDPAVLNNTLSPIGGTGNLEIVWKSSLVGGPVDDINWFVIPGANALTYDPPVTSQTIFYVRCVRRAGCPDYLSSNIIKITLNPAVIISNINITDVLCFGNNTGQINLTVSGGKLPYTFNWSNSLPSTEDQSNLSAGNYTVTVTDANGCSDSKLISVKSLPELNIDINSTSVKCEGNNDGTISLTVTGGTSPYTYNWSNGLPATPNQTGLAPGNYNVTVTDFKGCSKVINGIVIKEHPGMTLSITKLDPKCNGGNDGSINLTVTGGTAPYTFNWSGSTPDVEDPTGLTAGTYSVTVTDANGCTKTAMATITEPPAILLTSTVVNAKCNGGNDGSINLTVTGGTAPYTFNWSGSTPDVEDPTGLTAGTYSVTITDANGCTKTATATITEPPAILLTSTVVNVKCNGGNDGSINLTVTGGTAPYTFNWSGSTPDVEDPTGLTAGTYSVTVTDANGCTKTATATITEPPAIFLTSTVVNVKCNGGNDGSINLTVTGGTAPYTFNWSGSTPDVEDPTGLTAGTYSVTVTDANGCTKTATATITEPPAILLTSTVVNVKCNGGNDGSINLTVSGGTAPYTFNWSGSTPDVEDPTGLTSGTYSVTVTDANGCTKTATATITEPLAILLTSTVVNVKCNGGNDGSINLTVTGGTAPYTFNWSGSTPDVEDPTGLTAGTYSVTVTDANGCTKTATATITEPPAILLTSTVVNVKCNAGNDGSINLTVSGGTAPYTFNWSGSTPDVEDPTGLTAGTYSVTVTDANGCTKTATATITEPPAILLTSTVVNVKCNGGNDGSINLTVTGGTAPYTFNWSGSTPDVEDPTGLTAGTYSVTVTDANGCTKTATATITEPPAILLTSTVVNVKCNGGNDGSINLTVSGGTAPYTFNWSGSTPDVEDPTGLTAGTYSVTVTDANGCTKTATATITEPPAILLTSTVVNVKCNAGNDGSINLTVTGGTAPYTFNWSGSTPDVEDPTGLTAGTYSVTVTDANGCTKTATATITEPPAILLTSTVVNVKCNGGNDGSINLTVTGGTAPYTFNWSGSTPDVEDPTGLTAGTYSVTVTDANGCIKTATATITEPPAILLTSTVVNVKCNGGNDGSINLTVTGGTAPYTFNWSGSTPDVEDPTGLIAGTYSVTVTDANGCTKTATATITEPPAILLTSTVVNVKCNGGNDGSINLTVTGGTAPYTFNWSGSTPDVEDPTGLTAGTYSVTVTDANGCTKTATATITEPPAILLTSTVVNVKCNGGNDGSINLTVSGGTAPYTFNWSGSTPDVEDPTGLTAGTYSVTVTDANGCTKTATATITEPPAILLTSTVVNVKCNGGNDGSINLTVSGGTAPYTFNWSGSTPDEEDPTGLTAGTYSVTVTDANGCTKTATATITEPPAILLTSTVVNVKCNGGNDGSINLTVTGGTAPYTFNWSGSTPDVEDPTGLTAGTYSVTVTDANGCTKTTTATIDENSTLALSTTVVNVKCNGGNDGSINLTVTGGTAPYTFNWSGSTPDVEDPTGLTAGTYSVTVTDANGCTKTATATITEPPAILLTSTVINVKCNGGNDGSINLTVSGGTAPYTFNWSGSTPDVEDPTGLTAGNYSVTVTDANGCTKTATATITEPPAILLTSTVVNVKCNGGNDGSINLTVSGGTAPYTFNWSGSTPDVEDPTGLTAGTYSVTVTDANGCTKTATATITEPPAILLTSTVVNVKCNGGNDGSINLTVTGGTAPYTFNWSGSTPDVEDPTGLTASTYSVTVTDANGCTKTATATINEPPAILLTSTVVNVKCNGGNDGSINLTVSGGTAPYTFNWSGSTPDVEDPTGLTAGTYSVTVTDANGCTKTATVTITEPPAILLTSTVVNVKCKGGNDGSINLTVTGGTAPYTFNWSGSTPDVEDPTGLTAGTYSVTVTDANGCTKTATATITEPPAILLTSTVVNVKCNGGNDGSINLTVTGGTAPYTFNWSGSTPDVEDPTGLTAGTYSVTVTDANACTKTATVTIDENSTLALSTTVVNVKCNGGNDGSVNLTVTGGTAPYTFNWSGSTPDVEDPTGLTAGTYSVTVTDANGCTKTATATITEPPAILLTSTVVNVKCNGGNDGSINLTVTGGTAPYTFNWSGSTPDVEDPTGLTAGTYSVTVTDANGCTKTLMATITEPPAILLTSTVVNVKCNGGNDGSINLTVTGGTAPYTFNWSGSTPDVEDPTGLTAGTYSVTVTDANGCTKTAMATITEPPAILLTSTVVNVKCNGGNDGSINLTVTGGTAPYTFNWSGSTPDVEDPTGLTAGTYSVTVTDANGCTKTATATITEPPSILLTSTVVNVKCNGGNDGSINLTVTGGTAPYTFNWSGSTPDVEDPTGLTAGTYSVTVTDANGCTKTATATITEPPAIFLTSTVVNVKCNGGNDGSINLTVTGGTAPYTFNWTGSTPDVEDPTGLTAGTYSVTVTDANGCTKTASATITEPPAILLTSTVVNVKCNGGNDGSINLTVTGGTAPYTFNWSGSTPDVEDPTGLTAGTYSVTVTDANGCTKTATATITEPPAILLTSTVVNVKCNGGNDGSINLTVTGGTAPYTFNWSGSTPDVEDPTGLTAGTYSVTVTDAVGCKKTATAVILEPSKLIISCIPKMISCKGANDGSIAVTVSGGTAPYSFNWDNAPDVQNPSNLSPGNYSLTVTDANGCTIVCTSFLMEPTELIVTAVVKDVTCFGGKDGSIIVTVTGGTAPYSYDWNILPDVKDQNGLMAGSYTLIVTDSKGCFVKLTFNIKEPTKIILTATQKPTTCKTSKDGSIDLTVSGGTAPYSYNWSGTTPDVEDPTGLGTGNYTVTVTDSKGCTATLTIMVMLGTQNCANVGDYVWLDSNRDGIQNVSEMGINGISVSLIDVGPDMLPGTSDDQMVAITTTATKGVSKGYYLFQNVIPGKYVVMFMPDLTIYNYSPTNVGTNDNIDSDASSLNGKTPVFTVNNGDPDNLSLDAGLWLICDNITNGGKIGFDEILCGPGSIASKIVSLELPSGGFGNLEYVWMYSEKDPKFSPNNPDWYMIPNSNSPEYSPGQLFKTTYFVRCSRREGCKNYTGETDVVIKEVLLTLPVATITKKPLSPLCKNQSFTFEALINNIPDVEYEWHFGPTAFPSAAIGSTATTAWSTPGTKIVTLTVSVKGFCKTKAQWVVTINNCTSTKIKFVNFNAVSNDKLTTDLTWETTPIDKDHEFIIQRSNNGLNFEDLSKTNGIKTFNGSYNKVDFNPIKGDNFYRIALIDADGNIELSEVRKVKLIDNSDDFIFYPNPFSEMLNIKRINLNNQKLIVDILGINGALIKSMELLNNESELDLSDIPSGMYYITIKDENSSVITRSKILKQGN